MSCASNVTRLSVAPPPRLTPVATQVNSEAREAMRDSLPIALGYFTVALAFGLYAVGAGIPTAIAGLISVTNLSSSGQFAGIMIHADGGTWAQLALGVILVNLRYVLMGVSLGQRLDPATPTWQRLVMAAGITDEIYALGMGRPHITFANYTASMVLPIAGWTTGTVVGAAVGEVLPDALRSAFGVLLYAMFVAIVVPAAKASGRVLAVVLGAVGLSVALSFVPGLAIGWRISLATVIVCAIAATVLPVPREEAA